MKSGKKTITRETLAQIISDQFALKFTDAYKYVDDIINCMSQTLITKNKLKISMFGSWQIKHKKAREGRNPKTLKTSLITERYVVQFKLAPTLRKKLNNGSGVIG